MNTISIKKIRDEYGTDGWKAIEQLAASLYSPDLSPNNLPSKNDPRWISQLPRSARISQSIVTRSEVGVFGISTPRFCYRLYFGTSNDFINCRRLKELLHEISSDPRMNWIEADNMLIAEEKHPRVSCQVHNITLRDFLENCQSELVADCLLQPPQRLPATQYHIITAKLHCEYGEHAERIDQEPNYFVPYTTPFVKPLSFAGGLCAQACCFVATAILHKLATGVFGLGEITTLASSDSLRELLIAGLDESEIITYFNKINLRSILQVSNPNVVELAHKNALDTQYKEALYGYITSGFPIIASVDQASLNGRNVNGVSIYASNAYKMTEPPSSPRHSITLVGCTLWNQHAFDLPSNQTFEVVFMDSDALPFMKATLEQYVQVGNRDYTYLCNTFQHPSLLPVTPFPVKMPLLHWMDNNNICHRGLIALTNMYSADSTFPGKREFILRRVADMGWIRQCRHFVRHLRSSIVELFKHTLPSMIDQHLNINAEHWVWLECAPGIVRIWDAEIEPISANPGLYLLATIMVIDQTLSIKWNRMPTTGLRNKGISPVISDPQLHTANYRALTPALITSFCTTGVYDTISNIPSNCEHIELYCFMQNDIMSLFQNYHNEAASERTLSNNVISILSDQYDMCGADDIFSKKIVDTYGNKVVSFATFIPELMSPHKYVYETAQKAIMFLINTAKHLKNENNPFTVEIVCGSRLHGIYLGMTTQGKASVVVRRLSQNDAIKLFIERLKPIAECACSGSLINIALELEPGPLFTLGSKNDILELTKILNNSTTPSAIKKCTGFNLDIPHWSFLSDISVEWLKTQPAIINRIIHAHISDHGKGHFSDGPINLFNPGKFKIWIDFLRTLERSDKSDNPRMSGIISCEIEACKCIRYVSKSFDELLSLLK